MNKPRNQSAPDDASTTGRRKTRQREEDRRAKDDAGLETYEQSPERPGSDRGDAQETPDGPVPPATRPAAPD